MTKEAIPLNTALYTQRKLRGWSQAKLAELIGASEEMISKWERGKKRTSPYYQEKLCVLFGKNAEELGFLLPHTDERTDLIPAQQIENQLNSQIVNYGETARDTHIPLDNFPFHQREKTPSQFSYEIKQGIIEAAQTCVEDDGEQLRRQLLQRHREDLFYPEPYERLRYALRKPSAIDDATLEHLENITDDCWKMIPGVSGIVSHHSLRYVLEHLDTVTRLLENSQPTMTHKRLCSIAGKLSLVVANIASNLWDYNTAKIYYEISIEAGQEANNIPLQAVSLVRLSFNLTRSDRPDMALSLIQTADYLVTQSDKHATITTRAWIAAALAEVYANLSDAKACFEALERAEFQKPSPMRDDDPYHTTFSPSLLAGYKGVSCMLLHLPEDAEQVLNGALEQLPASSIYQKGYILSDLAASCIQQGKLEEMFEYASGALAAAIQTKAPEIFQRVLKLRNSFALWASTSSVKNLEAQIHSLEPYFYSKKDTA